MSEKSGSYVRSPADMEAFDGNWKASGGAERANYQLFLAELCRQLGIPQPEPTRPDDNENGYVFERTVTLQHGDGNTSPNYIDLYKRGCFVLGAKQGSDKPGPEQFRELEKKYKTGTARRGTRGWDRAMQAAKNQAERYAKALPLGEAILERLVALNNERAAEEAQGRVRWLSPDYQNPGGATEAAQETLPGAAKAAAPVVTEKLPWPTTLPEQIAAVRTALARQTVPIGAKELKKLFKNAREAKALEILQALASIGQAREIEDGRYLI